MKKVSIVSLIAVLAIIISSCGSSNNVVSNNGISKRKYNKGFFFNRKSNLKTADSKVKDADLKENKSIANVEKRKVKKANKSVNITENTSRNETIAELESEETSNEITNEIFETSNRTSNADLSEDALDLEETENETTRSNERVVETKASDKNSNAQKSSNRGRAGDVHIVILVILALIIPPLAVYLFEELTNRFWIDLILALVGIGLGLGLGGIAYIASLAAIIYALLIVLQAI